MKGGKSGGAGGGCCGVLALLLALGVVIALIQWAVQHAVPLLLVGLAAVALWIVIWSYAQRVRRARVRRRSTASLRVEAARTGFERRLTIAQEFMRLSVQTLDACPTEAERIFWATPLDDIAAEADLLRRSALDPQGARLPDPAPRDRLDAATLTEAVESLCALLTAALDASQTTDWQQQPERLRELRRERTRLLVAQDAVAQRLQQ